MNTKRIKFSQEIVSNIHVQQVSLSTLSHVMVMPTSGHATVVRGLQYLHQCKMVIQVSSVPDIGQELEKDSTIFC